MPPPLPGVCIKFDTQPPLSSCDIPLCPPLWFPNLPFQVIWDLQI